MKLGFLNPLFERPGPWASVYFDTALTTQDALTRHELAAQEAVDQLARDGADRPTCEALHNGLLGLKRATAPAGHALFASHGEVVLDAPLEAPPASAAQAWWSALPHVEPLLELTGTRPACLVAYIDRRGADFEEWGPLGIRPAGEVSGEQHPLHRTSAADWSERHWQQSVEDTWDHNAGVIAEALTEARRRTGAPVLVLAGDPRERRAVHGRLPAHLREQAVETEFGGRAPGARRERLAQVVEDARADYAERRAREVLDRFHAGRHPDGQGRLGAAEGVPALVEAAREHRIDALLVSPDGTDLHREVWIGRDPDQLGMRRSEIAYLGDDDPRMARADDALLRSAVTTDAEVVPVRLPETGAGDGPAGGLGALLRWAYDQETEGAGHATTG
ncbi:Vms1/Ankzf1 family peptidyl-tRNA hydrolase [Streptomyces aidingensis]|uniref:Peptide chain release factor 1 (ERF1) n=1 Tax=Streptomyces aidingensis TaxID=910347 RepID=A0A1I1LKY6_9ACTN|nr:Vms1/Ankzf1 family peptidyl-tRNA hydrolase [Streptomyces aidingensis]SFC70983.1 hypothetical protein SAMN05421773_105166 [Streptomyces aidingensis]